MNTRVANYELNKTIFRVTYGDITQLKTEAIVSSDDNYLSMGGGVSGAISKAGGKSIREEARKYIPLKVGDVAVTSAGNLPAKYIFHAVTIDYTKMIYPYENSIKAAT
jgi:O-acetyl-ADP-ribose deacetylase (regulator of RNase III)